MSGYKLLNKYAAKTKRVVSSTRFFFIFTFYLLNRSPPLRQSAVFNSRVDHRFRHLIPLRGHSSCIWHWSFYTLVSRTFPHSRSSLSDRSHEAPLDFSYPQTFFRGLCFKFLPGVTSSMAIINWSTRHLSFKLSYSKTYDSKHKDAFRQRFSWSLSKYYLEEEIINLLIVNLYSNAKPLK